MNNISEIHEWLDRSCSIKVPDDWLTACVEWIEEENEGSNLTLEQIKNLVYEQWLLSDLCDLKTQYLPDYILNSEKCEVSGPIPLQINKIVDVGVSTYSQVQKAQGTVNDNASVCAEQPNQPPWEPKPSRMLLMQLTDGTTEVQGMEYKSIPDLNPDLPPGIKIILLGTVLCRRTMLMLKRENVKVLGGEVDTLVEANSKLAVLQDLLQRNKEDSGKEYKETYEGGPVRKSDCKKDIDEKYNVKTEMQTRAVMPGTQCKTWASSLPPKNTHNKPRNNSTASSLSNQNTNNSNIGKKSFTLQNVQPKKDIPEISDQEWDTDFNYDELMDDMDDFEDDIRPSSIEMSSNSSVPNRNKINTEFSKVQAPTQPININININMPSQNNRPVNTDSYTSSNLGRQSITKPPSTTNKPCLTTKKCEGNFSRSDSGNEKKQKMSSDFPCADYVEDMDFDDDFEFTDSWKTPAKQPPVPSSSTLSSDKSNSIKPKQTMLKNVLSSSVKKQNSLSNPVSTQSGTTQKRKQNSFEEQQNSRFQSTMDTFMNNRNSNPSKKVKMETPKKETGDRESDGISRQPFTYLSTVKKYLQETDVKKARFSAKAYVSTISSKLESNSGQRWSLSCKINDGTDSLDCDISNIVLVELIGFSAAESQTMKKRIKEEPELKDLIIEGIQQCQEKLINLSCIMDIEITRFSGKAEIIKLVPLTDRHTQLLYENVSAKV